ncbi:extracellular serine-threonine rich protein [Aspergillus undulatus]|uniref:extracellular serine-threonine rich protein n=1 Tax=Aspergillus undulatus TaxID=1810928 RepID=UPI003CCE27D4
MVRPVLFPSFLSCIVPFSILFSFQLASCQDTGRHSFLSCRPSFRSFPTLLTILWLYLLSLLLLLQYRWSRYRCSFYIHSFTMKTTSLVSVLSFLASAQATGLWWGSEECYTAPEITDNECSEQQQTGFNWDSLDIGDFTSFGGLDFSGFSCSRGFGGLRTRTYNNKCITGNIGKGGITKSSAPSISCGQDKPGFSIDKFHLFTSVETDVTISFGMPDGSTCKKTSSCNSAGTEVSNDQCGGAISVGFELPEHSDHDDCDFGIGSIGFVCGPGKPTYTPPAETPSPSSSETPTPDLPTSTPISTPLIPTKTPTIDTPSVEVPTATPTGSSPVTSSTPVIPPTTSYSSHEGSTSVPFTLSTVYTTSEVTITQCAPTVTDCPASSTQTTTSTVLVSTTWCPVIPTETPTVPTESSSDVPPPPVETETSETPAPPVSTETPSSPGSSTPVIPTSVNPGSSSVPPAPEESVTTEITYTTVTWCPVTDTVTSGESTFTTVTTSTWDTTTLTSTTTICGGCTVTDLPSPSETPAVPTETPDVPTDVEPTETPEAPETTPEAPASTVTEVTYTTVTTCPVTETITTGESTIITTYSTVSTQTLTSSSTIVVPTDVLPTETPAPTSDVPGQTVTEITYTTVTTCPVTETVTTGDSVITTTYSTVSTQILTSTSTIPAVPTSASPEETETPTVSEETTSTPVPTSSCPNVVPKCINTWLNLIPDCKSNSDVTCFCPNDEFIGKVINCVQAWGADDEVQSALSYLTGICANFVPENPGIITHVPTTITLTPPAAPTPTDVSPGQPESPAPTSAPSAPCTTITYSTYTVTVPQVEFSTATVTETAAAGGGSGATGAPAQPTIELIPQPPAQATPTGVDATGGSTTVPNPWTGGAGTTLATNTPSQSVTPSPTGPVFTGAASPLRVPMTWFMVLAVPVLAL